MASSDMSDSDATFEVDHILKQRKRKGVIEYLVRWKGFGKSEDSWEPGKNLKHAAEALATYLKIVTAPKTPKKSRSRSRSSSRSRTTKTKGSPSRTPRARSRTPKPKSPPSRSRSRSSSRGRSRPQASTKVKESPSRQSKRTEVITKTTTSRDAGKIEKKVETIRHTTEEIKPIEMRTAEMRTARVLRSQNELRTVEDKVDGKPTALKIKTKATAMGNYLHTLWETADTAFLIISVCISIIALSYVVENYCSPSDMWKYTVGFFTAIAAAMSAFCQSICTFMGKAWETTANFTRNSWKKVTN